MYSKPFLDLVKIQLEHYDVPENIIFFYKIPQ